MKSIEDQLKDCILSKYKSIREFSIDINMPYSTVDSVFKRGVEKSNVTTLIKICRRLGISVDALTRGEIMSAADSTMSPYTPRETDLVTKYRACDNGGKEMVDRVLDYEYHRTNKLMPTSAPPINIVDYRVFLNSASAGFGNYLDNDTYEVKQFAATDIPPKADFALYISGNSMEPKYPDGCIVFVESRPAIDPGDVGIFALDDNVYCKKLIVDHDKQEIRLESINPDYAPITVSPDQTLYTFGKVVGHVAE